MQKFFAHAALSGALFIASAGASAIEAGGVRFDDTISVGGSELLANGAGVRRKFVFDVYAIALYLPSRANSAEGVAAQEGKRRIAVHLLRDVSAGDFVDALKSGLQENLDAADYAALQAQIEQFGQSLLAIKEVRRGTAVWLDYLPASGTRITVAGQVRGTDIAGRKFYDALLKIWIGRQPVQADLKTRLLGK